jgi:glycosyltransferase involved in cell wall biosynthesis
MTDSQPKISVVTAVYQGAATLGRLLESVDAQRWPARELVVMDGGSTDGTVDILAANSDRIAFWTSAPDEGVYDAWNRALGHITGDWVLFLGADDYLWDPRALADMVPHLLRRGGRCPLIYGTTRVVDGEGSVLRVLGDPWPVARTDLTWDMPIPNPSTFYRRDLFERVGRFDPSFRSAGDYEFLLRVCRFHDAFFVPDVVVTGMQSGGLSDELRHKVQAVREVLRAQRRHGLRRLPPALSWRLLRVRAHVLMTRLLGVKTARRLANRFRGFAGKPPLG